MVGFVFVLGVGYGVEVARFDIPYVCVVVVNMDVIVALALIVDGCG